MARIKITFDGLIAYFTGNLGDPEPELIVGLMDVSDWLDAPETDYHYPVLTIKSAGRVLKKYEGFGAVVDELYGLPRAGNFLNDIFLQAPAGAEPIHVHNTAPANDDERQPFNNIVMIDQLSQGLVGDPERCKARLHFGAGFLYSTGRVGVTFLDPETQDQIEDAPTVAATMVGLDIAFPDDEYAVLHFQRNAEDFVFKGGADYQVSLSNNPSSSGHQANEHGELDDTPLGAHFDYYYDLSTTEPTIRPILEVPDETDPTGGSPRCLPGGYDEP